ncbi:uncharacterized protein EV422DRAFT_540063 [Fimicolochytrium jonesii]|uniref:uncharacterized protein n=1 Tax=Fimicolochytrium jonesii TaxID=1396493 RepID=UPI0022FF2BA8|nr:uncharacterized protein EV422DRAFT_540063 [Fimicolochytrium jonesii]KAI8817816.1 hypothetical protein EV422DRAFT_540063 [Fimicolochytrium jonesii]
MSAITLTASRIGSCSCLSSAAPRVSISISGGRHVSPPRPARGWARGMAAKTAVKTEPKGDAGDDSAGPLPPFYPRPPTGPLPNLSGLSPSALQIPYDPRGHKHGARLLRSIDVDLRSRLDSTDPSAITPQTSTSNTSATSAAPNRAALFLTPNGPHAVVPGSILLIENVTSRTRPRTQIVAGVLIAIRRKGVLSNIVVRNYVLGTGFEMTFPIFSPNVRRIKVLKRVEEGDGKGKAGRKGDTFFEIRENPQLAPTAFGKIDEMVIRDREAERRARVMSTRR